VSSLIQGWASYVISTKEGKTMELPSILNPSAKHAYEVEVADGHIIVHANNRTQAGALVRKLGYEVLGVSMTG